ncbi:MAG TPA: sodium-independent anion transporter, partial [Jatrophihabitans sp.]|nr:sodium-independent anion transporter [Jatrophihabitans sp.]
RGRVRELAADLPRPGWVVAAAEPVTDLDTTAADMLIDLHRSLAGRGISLVFAELKDPVRHKFATYAPPDKFAAVRFFPTVESAVSTIQRESGAAWHRPPADARQ